MRTVVYLEPVEYELISKVVLSNNSMYMYPVCVGHCQSPRYRLVSSPEPKAH